MIRGKDDVDYCYNNDNNNVDAEAEEVIGGDKGNLKLEKENPGTKSSMKAAASCCYHKKRFQRKRKGIEEYGGEKILFFVL